MNEQIDQIRLEVDEALKSASSVKALEEIKVRFLGRKGPIQQLMQGLRSATPEERPHLGKTINELKVSIEDRLGQLEESIGEAEESARLEHETVDVTLPGRPRPHGRVHPVSQVMDEALSILMEMGFAVQYGPEIESDFYNFGALNFPPDHPARDEHDTFYINPKVLLRTHTSPTQIRVMEKYKPPIRVVTPGRVYRNEDITARSHCVFHQIEGLYVDKDVSMADLMATLQTFIDRLFDKHLELRFRPSYFPFVEPGIEVDARCCDKESCTVCKGSGWLEILGAGMVHPEVLTSGGLDPETYTGYAWGMGVDRLVMLRHGINDIRHLSDNDMRFLSQFG